MEMVTDEIKKEMIKGPFKMMPKLLEMIYFNKDHPENHTMKLVNKNKEVMKVHKEEGWKLVDKTDTIDYVLEDKNYEVDNYYDERWQTFQSIDDVESDTIDFVYGSHSLEHVQNISEIHLKVMKVLKEHILRMKSGQKNITNVWTEIMNFLKS